MTDREYNDLRASLRDLCGVVLEDDKRYLMEGRLAPVVRRLELASVSEFAARLQAQPRGPLATELVEALVTTESYFFRDVHPWDALRTSVIPELIRRRASERRLVFWCAAASTGQEPYSLAMLLADHFPELATGWRTTILATDVSKAALDRARAGRYSRLEVDRGLPASLLARHFRQDGLNWQLNDGIRSRVEFRELNLCHPWSTLPPGDLVMLRNVMIYFDAETKKAILARVARAMRQDGYLLLGAAETTLNLDASYARVPDLKASFYRRAER